MIGWAKPGVKCMCIAGGSGVWRGPEGEQPLHGPKLNVIYTIADVEAKGDGVFLILEECDPDDMFNVRYFRPLVDEAGDVALFAHHLDRVGEPA